MSSPASDSPAKIKLLDQQQNEVNEEINELAIPEYGGEDIDEVEGDDYGSSDDEGNEQNSDNNSNLRLMQEMIEELQAQINKINEEQGEANFKGAI